MMTIRAGASRVLHGGGRGKAVAFDALEQLESRLFLSFTVSDWFPMAGGNEWGLGGRVDDLRAEGMLNSGSGVQVGQHTTTRMRTRVANEMDEFQDERFLKQSAAGLRLLQVNRWGDYGSQSIRYRGAGVVLLRPTVNVGDVFTYSTTFTGSTERGSCSGTVSGTVHVVAEEDIAGEPRTPLNFHALRVVRTEVLNATGDGWTSRIDISDTLWLAWKYGVAKWQYQQRDRTSDATDQTTTFDLISLGGNLFNAIVGLQAFGNGNWIERADRTPSLSDGTNFDVIDVNGQTKASTFTFQNMATGPINIRRVVIAGRDNSDFKVVQSPVGDLAPGQTATLIVQFNPIAAGVRTAKVRIESSDPFANPYVFKVVGLGVLLGRIDIREAGKAQSITPGSTTPTWATGTVFGNVSVNNAHVERQYVISNVGPGDLQVKRIYVTNRALYPEFLAPIRIVAIPLNGTIAPGESGVFIVAFDPDALGTFSANVFVETNDRHTPVFQFLVRGTGV